MRKSIIRLRVKEFMKAQIDKDIPNDAELAKMIGISLPQIWRAKLSPEDSRYNAPGNHFIAGVLRAFNGRFEDFFYVDEVS